MTEESQAEGTSTESWKNWQEAWEVFYETVSRIWPQVQTGSKEQTMFGKPGPFEVPDPVAAWTQWCDAAMRDWQKEMGMQDLPSLWREMIVEAHKKMQEGKSTPEDPFAALKRWYDTTSETWSRAVGDAIGAEQFVGVMSRFLASYTSFSRVFRQTREAYFSNLQLPTRSDIARVASLVVNLEEKVDRIEDSLWQLETHLGQVESKLGKVLAVLEKMERGE